MVDSKKTEQLYTKQGLVYQKKPHGVEYERWYNCVTNPHKKDRPATGRNRNRTRIILLLSDTRT
jgi:hypothetical protein